MCMTTRKRWSWVVYATGEEMIESNGGGEGGGFASCGIIKAADCLWNLVGIETPHCRPPRSENLRFFPKTKMSMWI